MNDKEVKARLQALGWTVMQVNASSLDALGVAKVLETGEVIERATHSKIGKGKGLLLATDRRLVFVSQGLIKIQSESFRPPGLCTSMSAWSISVRLIQAGATSAKKSLMAT